MKNQCISRRQFFKLNAFGAGALALASVATAPSREAQAATVEPHKLAIPQPTFNPIASATVFGPPTDLSAGWDGTLWAIDASGAPHLYDPTSDAWLPHGEGIDAAAYDEQTQTIYLFRGSQYVTVNRGTNQTSAPIDIAATWPTLPDSFKMGVNGAAFSSGKLYLFNGGWYLPADGSAPRRKLTEMGGWPQTANWQDGLFDALINISTSDASQANLFRGSEYISLLPADNVVLVGPQPIAGNWNGFIPADWQTSGFDAGVFFAEFSPDGVVYKGAAASVNGAAPSYIASAYTNWPVVWNPRLNHAPSGRMGNLWCATTAQGIVQHDGENWNVIAGRSASVAVGQDNSIYVVSGDNQTIDTFVLGTGWVATATAPVQLTKVAVGDAGHVFVLGNDGSVRRLVGSTGSYSYTSVNLGAGVPNPTHIAANADGTVWHCNSTVANAGRFISEASAPSAAIPVKQGVVTGVQKVASTGFGAAHCLVTQSGQSQPQVYRYDSPYLFKTGRDYPIMGNGGDGFLGDATGGTFAQGLGKLYCAQFVAVISGISLTVRFVALDAHTGREVASYAPPAGVVQYTGLVFDPINELIYVGVAPWAGQPNQTSPGQLIALDARTLAVQWTFPTPGGIDATPALSGTQLCFGDRTNTLFMIDTSTALAAARQSRAITPEWTWVVPTRSAVTHRTSSPVIANSKIYVVAWDLGTEAIGGNAVGYYHYLAMCDAATGLNGSTSIGDFIPDDSNKPLAYQFIVSAPVLGKVRATDQSEPDAIYVNDGFSVYVHSLDATKTPIDTTFALPTGQISTGFAYDDGSRLGLNGQSLSGIDPTKIRLWFGDSVGNLWSLGDYLRPTDYTPKNIAQNTRIVTTPILYKDPQGGLTTLFGVLDSVNILQPNLYGFDPDNGNTASLPTGVTDIAVLTAGVTNGLVYAGGVSEANDPPNTPKQVFGIRVDTLPQALRDFVIESQMMQDPDQNGSGNITSGQPLPPNPIPPSIARYQTHLTVVDDQKTPLAHEPVKIWCDTPDTKITVEGQPFTIGPGDTSFAAVKTGTDGALVIMMDATDYFAPTLRAWASFMDPYERIVINPDAEFHQRVMTAHANASDDDPDKVNLQTATNYKGTSLFTADEKSQNPSQPQNVANSIQQANKGLGLSNTDSKGMYRKLMRAMGVKHKNQRISVRLLESNAPPFREGMGVGETPDKYMAYADLSGAAHFPTNIPASRLASVVQPIGLSFSRVNGDCTKAPTFSAMAHADARAAIDALQGAPWQPSDPHSSNPGQCIPPRAGAPSDIAPHRAFNIFQDFWNWLKGLVDKITQCILSIAEDILAGIQYIVNGILKVFKAIIRVLEDVFPFLGSFFKMLEKLIDDVVAALSTLFHFGEIIKTHTWLRDQINANLQQTANAMQAQVKPPVDAFFNQGEQAIENLFNSIRQKLGINADTQINSVNSARSTAHTVFTAGPGTVGANSAGSSHAVQCMHTAQKMKTGLPSATSQGQGILSLSKDAPAIAADDDDALSAFVTNFVSSLQNNPVINTAFNNLKSAINDIGHPQSAGSFFKAALNLLLTLLEDLILGMVAVTQALVDGLIGAIQALVNTALGLLNTPVDIPFLSWLYQLLFGEPLTILNAVSLVAAIPVTVMYRVVEGHYPSQDGITGVAAAQAQRVAAITPDVIKKMQGLIGGTIALGLGIARGVVDAAGPNPPRIGTIFVLTFGVAYIATYFPLMIPGAMPTPNQWAEWGLGMALALLGTFGVINLKNLAPETQVLFKEILTFLRVALGSARFIVFIITSSPNGNPNALTDVQFARNLFLELPPMFNWLKLAPEPANLVLVGIDALTGIVVCALDITAAFLTSAGAPRRYYFPFVPVQR